MAKKKDKDEARQAASTMGKRSAEKLGAAGRKRRAKLAAQARWKKKPEPPRE